MGQAGVTAFGSTGPQFIYGQLSSSGYVATATFPLESFPLVPGAYTTQLRYRGRYDSTLRAIYFNLEVYASSATISSQNAFSFTREPDFAPAGSVSGGNTVLSVTMSGGNIIITYNSQAMAEGYQVKETGEGCFVRAQQIILQE